MNLLRNQIVRRGKKEMDYSYLKLGLLISTFLVSFFPSTFSQLARNSTLLLVDTDGHQLQTNTKYYIFPAQSGNGGGLALSAKDFPCQYYVMQENLEDSNGLPLKFFPADTKQQIISLSSDVNIAFNAATICVQSTVWRIGGGGNNGDNNGGRRYVISTGVAGHPGADTLNNWFRFEKIGIGYKIVFCPSVCNTCKFVCGDVGVFSENGKRWLGLTDDGPFVFVFKKA
ncbi:OLC1v1033028C1 [Oldenlandia corymbosa var. corymbosa]|uniref:OLC1v1033028C1 n=1 Tax=Oldenlandia corymbosa var. corymbosa TaxID=529605 RepID=A0AAV1CQM2_OLDCO|nr:OLC1v1033028C1 [Oldenlandia corymbosa var. corymbosa]